MAILATAAFYQSALIGWWRGEAKYKGRYTNSWRAEMRSYDTRFIASLGIVDWGFVRAPSKWEIWLAKLLPGYSPTVNQSPPLQDGDPEAVSLLLELLKAPEPIFRIMAASGLEKIGPPAREAVSALSALVNVEDGGVGIASRQALRAIDPKFYGSIEW
jgi:hypothetical protein